MLTSFSTYLSPTSCCHIHGAALLIDSQKCRLAFTAIVCATFALIKASDPLQVLALSGQATPLKGGKLGRSADLKDGI